MRGARRRVMMSCSVMDVTGEVMNYDIARVGVDSRLGQN